MATFRKTAGQPGSNVQMFRGVETPSIAITAKHSTVQVPSGVNSQRFELTKCEIKVRGSAEPLDLCSDASCKPKFPVVVGISISAPTGTSLTVYREAVNAAADQLELFPNAALFFVNKDVITA